MSNKDLPATMGIDEYGNTIRGLTKLEEVSTRILCAMLMRTDKPPHTYSEFAEGSKVLAGQLLGDKPDAEPEG